MFHQTRSLPGGHGHEVELTLIVPIIHPAQNQLAILVVSQVEASLSFKPRWDDFALMASYGMGKGKGKEHDSAKGLR